MAEFAPIVHLSHRSFHIHPCPYHTILPFFVQLLFFKQGLGENWIDFEKEIAKIIQLIENRILKHGGLGMLCCHSLKYPDGIKIKRFESGEWSQFEKFLSVLNRFEKMTTDCIVSVHGIIDEASFLEFLYLQLRAFTRAFEIYCLDSVYTNQA